MPVISRTVGRHEGILILAMQQIVKAPAVILSFLIMLR